MCNLPLNCYIFVLSWLYRCVKHLKQEGQSIFTFHSLTWWVLQIKNVPEPFIARHCSTGSFGACQHFRNNFWNVGNLPFGREFASCRDALGESGNTDFIKNPTRLLILWDIFVVESGNLAKQAFHEKVLVSVNLSGNALENSDFYNIRCLLVTVKILIRLSETEFKCMILRNLMRSETVIFTKPLNIKQDYFDVRRTFWVIQTENTLILSVLKILSEL